MEASLLRLFEQIDRSGSGSLAHKELERFFKSVLSRPLTDQQIEDILSEATKDDPGASSIDSSKFCALVAGAEGSGEKVAQEAFGWLDTTARGHLTPEELVPAMQESHAFGWFVRCKVIG